MNRNINTIKQETTDSNTPEDRNTFNKRNRDSIIFSIIIIILLLVWLLSGN